MVFRRGAAGRNWYIQPKIPGMDRFPQLSTGTPNKQQAASIEATIHKLANGGYRDLVDRVRSGEIKLRDLYIAELEGPVSLTRLRDQVNDPTLAEAVEMFRPGITDKRIREGLDQLLALAPKGARLSYLTTPRNIASLVQRAVAGGRRPNSVRRSLWRAISDLLTHELGRSRKVAILSEVKAPGEKDTRDVVLTPGQIGKLLDACDEELRPLVLVAIASGIDQGPLLRLKVKHFEPSGVVYVPDTKTASRPRALPLPAPAAAAMRQATVGREPEEEVFGLTYKQLRSRWEAARAAAGMPWLRFKDLRGVFGTYWAKEGGSIRGLQGYYGHADPKMSLRYVKHLPQAGLEQAETAVRAMGLHRAHLKAEEA